jgi:hypothetical protein
MAAFMVMASVDAKWRCDEIWETRRPGLTSPDGASFLRFLSLLILRVRD